MSTKATSTKSVSTRSTGRARPESRAANSRSGAVPSPEMVNIFEAALSTPPRLQAKAWVRNVAYDKKVWLDLDLLSRSGAALHSETLPLQYLESAGGTGDFFLADVPLPPAALAARRTPPHQLRYRLYYEVEGQVFTDGVCHQLSL